jgi:AcrR family transcriptional regulator
MATTRQPPSETAVQRRTRRALLDAARRLIEEGDIPTIPDAAAAADVSRATAYRYFPSQAALLEAVLDERLDALVDEVESAPPHSLNSFVEEAVGALRGNEAVLRAALRLSLTEWRHRREAPGSPDRPITRGGRIALLEAALGQPDLDEDERRRLVMSLSLVFGIEAWVVLKDIWRVDDDTAQGVILWTARAIARNAGLAWE